VNVAELVLGIDEVIATEQVAVMLENQRAAAAFAKDAEAWLEAHPSSKRFVEGSHEHSANVTSDPCVEDLDQKLAELFR
jgi:hypothetical protein